MIMNKSQGSTLLLWCVRPKRALAGLESILNWVLSLFLLALRAAFSFHLNTILELKLYIMNAKDELDGFNFGEIKCAMISATPNYDFKVDYDGHIDIKLRVGHTKGEFYAFIKSLDFDYDAGYGGQELYGVIWLHNGNWMTRGEYDGSEWWEHNSLPEIPDELTQKGGFSNEDGGLVYICK